MNSMSIKGALRYEVKASLRSARVFLTVMVLVWLLNFVLAVTVNDSNSYSNGFEFAVTIYMFVAGLISVREDLRLFLQNGRGRLTVFIGQVFVALFASAFLAVSSSVMTGVFRLVTNWLAPELEYTTLYRMFSESGCVSIFSAMVESSLFTFLQCLPAFFIGMTISLIYYRLSGLGKTVFSIVVPVTLFVGVPVLLANNPEIARALVAFFKALSEVLKTPIAWLAAFSLIFSPILALGSWLLLRKAPIK